MARALIVGCGCHGRELGNRLRERGWLVRGTSRTEEGIAAIESAGLEAAVADPDRPGSVLELCADVGVVVWLLGSASGEHELVAPIHGSRLARLLEKLVDSPVRGFAYEAAGTVPVELLDRGREIVERAGRTWRIPIAIIEAERTPSTWADAAAERIAGSLAD